MKLGTRPRYSLRLMMAVAKLSSSGSPVGLGEVAQHCSISRRYLEQLVTPLKTASLLRSTSGRGGGYALAREPGQIKLVNVIEAAIGPISITNCASEEENCMHTDFCNCRALWSLINDRIVQTLSEYTLKDLMEDGWGKKINLEYLNSTDGG